MDVTVQVRKGGVVTLPAELRQKQGIREGDSYRVLDLDGILVLTPMVPMLPELAREIEKARLEAGLSVGDLLENLRRQRERYHRETYEPGQSSQAPRIRGCWCALRGGSFSQRARREPHHTANGRDHVD